MITPHLGVLADGIRGFDADCRISAPMAARFYAHGFRFAMRYVRRGAPNGHDLISGEIITLLNAGLAVGVVQHVAQPGWVPSAALGAAYGSVAALETLGTGMPRGATVFCDLEGVAAHTPAPDVLAYLAGWHKKVEEAGYHPGCYVGDSPGLTGGQLFHETPFTCFWGAYNLNADQIPIVRGLAMKQLIAKPGDRFTGCPDIDVDVLHADRLGGTPTFLLP